MKIFQCDMFTTNDGIVNTCEGGLYQECLFCTLNKNFEKKVIKGGKYRPPTVVIDDYTTSVELLDLCLKGANDLRDTLKKLLKKAKRSD